jgi:hypothetical protein
MTARPRAYTKRQPKQTERPTCPNYLELTGWDQLIANPHLSLAAKGLAAQIRSYPTFLMDFALKTNHNGRDAVRTAMRELEDAGYVVRTKRHLEHGGLTWDTYLNIGGSSGGDVQREVG